jgi:uncharacterized membrane protein
MKMLVCGILCYLLFHDSTHPNTLFFLLDQEKNAFSHFENPKSNIWIWIIIHVKQMLTYQFILLTINLFTKYWYQKDTKKMD